MISLSSLTVRRRGATLLEDISLTLKECTVYALLGENGSGKTTLMRTLTSYYPYQGSVDFSGRELATLARKERETLHALLAQNPPQADLTVEALMGIRKGGMKELEALGLERFARRRINQLSGGERQLVFLAFMLSQKAQLYCLDEPESSLDAHGRALVEASIARLKGEGRTVLASFHDINRALSLCDEVILLERGRLSFAGSVEDFVSSGVVEASFALKRESFTDSSGRVRTIFLS